MRETSRLYTIGAWTHLIEYVLKAFLCKSGTLYVFDRAEFPRKPLTGVSSNRTLLLSR